MDDEWIPSEIMQMQPWYRNFHENTATVQFNHRVLGMSTAAGAISLAAIGLSPSKAALITPQVRKGLYAIGLASAGQVTLGITTLLHYVPLSLAAAHQIGSIVVFTSGVYLAHSLRYARPAVLRSATCTAAKRHGAKHGVSGATVA
jgi:cytochrome c oxidase assembly protein subunit 15